MTFRVAVVVPTLNRGGSESVLVSIARDLARKNFTVSLVTLEAANSMKEEIPDVIPLQVLPSNRSSRCVPALARTIARLAPDLVVSTSHHMNIATLAASQLIGFSNVALRCPNTPSTERDLRWVTKVAAGWAYRRAQHIIAQTEEMKTDLIRQFRLDSAKVHVLQNPVDTELIDLKLARSPNPFDTNTVNIVTAGRLSQQKGIDVLIRAFAFAAADDSRLRLHVLGRDGGEEQALRALASDLGLTGKVVFRGEQANPYPFLKHCDLFVLASRWEGLPNVVLECIYLGTRVVATRTVPALERLINHGRSGFLVPVENEEALARAILSRETLTAPHPPLPQIDVAAFFAELVQSAQH